jgi:hypothetical protein
MSIPCPAPLPSSLPIGVDDEEVGHKVSDASVPTDESAMQAPWAQEPNKYIGCIPYRAYFLASDFTFFKFI